MARIASFAQGRELGLFVGAERRGAHGLIQHGDAIDVAAAFIDLDRIHEMRARQG